MRENDNNWEKERAESGGSGFSTGLVLGLLAGAVIAMVAAPQSGEDTRDLLKAKAREAADRARDTADDLSTKVNGTTADILERGRAIVEAARARIDGAIDEGFEAAESQRSELEQQL
jgi:gas vesicle protein